MDRTIELEILITERQATMTEIEGMKAENKIRDSLGEAITHTEKDFISYANKLRAIDDIICSLDQS